MQKRLIPAGILVIYAALVIKVLVFKEIPTIRIGNLMFNLGGTNTSGSTNFVPFKTVFLYLRDGYGLITLLNLVGNVIAFVPVGFLVPFVYMHMTWKKSLVLAVATGLAMEGMEVLFRVGIFDIDDVMLNALGVMVGYWVFVFSMRFRVTK